MSVTLQLLKLFQVDKQLRGLRSRLDSAEKFLTQQQAYLKDIDDKKKGIEAQLKQLRAAQGNDEGEAARVEARIEALREQMNSMKTAKEYSAAVAELNNFKEMKSKAEESALEAMGKIEALEGQLAELSRQSEDRGKLVHQADTDRTARSAEIKDRVEELRTQRTAMAEGIPQEALNLLESLIKLRGDDAMCPVEILDRRNHEYSCSGCMMTLPVEVVNTMLAGRLTRCVSCSCIVYTEEKDFLGPPPKPPGKSSKKPPKSKQPVANT
jgi:predicted  nucleic acid-binding Zn-ribbon protein